MRAAATFALKISLNGRRRHLRNNKWKTEGKRSRLSLLRCLSAREIMLIIILYHCMDQLASVNNF
jgi:hypothetical protein